MPFSPAHVEQAWNRIHRIGQFAPITGKITVTHLVPYGSVDAAIAQVHGDKQALINLIQEGDDSGFGGDTDAQWRKGCRIVDACLPLGESGSFGEMPHCQVNAATNAPVAGTTYTVLPGVITRGREPTAEQSAANAAASATPEEEDDSLAKMMQVAGVPGQSLAEWRASCDSSLAALRASGVLL